MYALWLIVIAVIMPMFICLLDFIYMFKCDNELHYTFLLGLFCQHRVQNRADLSAKINHSSFF